MQAKVFSNSILIGLADINIGDYFMGGLFGVFTPNEYYLNKVQKIIQLYNEEEDKDFQLWDSLDFKVELSDGYVFEPVGGITIDDFSEMYDEPIQITLMGVACDAIDTYFS